MPNTFKDLQDLMDANIPYTSDKDTFVLTGEQINDFRREIRCSKLLAYSVGQMYKDLHEKYDWYVDFDLQSRGKKIEAQVFLSMLEETVKKTLKYLKTPTRDYA